VAVLMAVPVRVRLLLKKGRKGRNGKQREMG
jgi:hypothetical protein